MVKISRYRWNSEVNRVYGDYLVAWRTHQSLHNLISFNFGVKWVCRGAGALGCTSGYVRECSVKRGGIAKRTRREGVLLSIVFHDFCQLPDCLKGLGCTIPFIHCSPTFTIRHHSTYACHFLFQRILPRHYRPPLSSLHLSLCQGSFFVSKFVLKIDIIYF